MLQYPSMSLCERLLYVYSCDLDQNVQIRIGALEGKLERPSYDLLVKEPSLQSCVAVQQDEPDACRDLFVTCEVYCDGRLVCFPVSTSYKHFTSRWNWHEWLTLPVKYNELSRDTQLAINIFDYHDAPEPHCLGGTTISLFSKRGVFRRGIYDLKVWSFQLSDGQLPCKTPGKVRNAEMTGDQMRRLGKLSKKHRSGLMEKVDWLDRLTFREIENINEREKRTAKSLFLMIEFPSIHHEGEEHLVVYFDRDGDQITYFRPNPTIVKCPDPEVHFETNLVEEKHHILARSARSGAVDRELKPTAATRNQLDYVLQAPPSQQLTPEQRDLIWKFRFYISNNKKALTKFLQSVQWNQSHEVKQALELLREWSPIDAEDALELLSPYYQHRAVRRYAVSRLAQAPRDDLLLYLLQLVQALKYERLSDIEKGTDSSFIQGFLESTVHEKSTEDQSHEPAKFGEEADESDDETEQLTSSGSKESTELPDLATFLISSACRDETVANYFYWYLTVECLSYKGAEDGTDQDTFKKLYNAVLRRLAKALVKGDTKAKRRKFQLLAQQQFVKRLVQIMEAVAKESGNRRKKTEFLQAQLSTQETAVNFSNLNALPLPLDPAIRVQNVVADRARLFNSALMPCKVTFRTVDAKDYLTIFKHGDDLRQDQLVIQMIRLIDRLLQCENLDLKLTPYMVLATGVSHGFVQFIESTPLRDVISEWNSVQEFFRFYRPSATGPFGIEANVIENYVRSCAGYSVICYLLGIGDRHLHNLLLCKNGRIFHVDFGYILGRDPKPMPPPMKLTREMIDAMGGINSSQWQEFRRLCYTAFLHLRRHANLILNLFSLMVDASIPDIAMEPDKAVKKVEERFHLNLTDEEAVLLMQHLIDASISAKMAALADIVHDWAQMLRN